MERIMEKRKRILVVNDDGIFAEGIKTLANAAKKFGDVWIVAPSTQCSAMSQRIIIYSEMAISECDLGIPGIMGAYALDGMPANCVKVALDCILDEKPDIVLSGVNFGYNAGYDIAYSGTVGAAREALMNCVPAISLSTQDNGVNEVVLANIEAVLAELIDSKPGSDELWNVNFPGCRLDELKGILRGRRPAKKQYYTPKYVRTVSRGVETVAIEGVSVREGDLSDGTDISALVNHYISIGTVKLGL